MVLGWTPLVARSRWGGGVNACQYLILLVEKGTVRSCCSCPMWRGTFYGGRGGAPLQCICGCICGRVGKLMAWRVAGKRNSVRESLWRVQYRYDGPPNPLPVRWRLVLGVVSPRHGFTVKYRASRMNAAAGVVSACLATAHGGSNTIHVH